MSYDESNVFARILRREIACHKVTEDADLLVLMDIMPQAPGHTLIIPKVPIVNILDAPPIVLAKLMPLAQRVAKAQLAAFAADGISIFTYSGEAGGQSVFHMHLHVIPIKRGSSLIRHGAKREKEEVLARQADLIRQHLA